VADVLEHHGSDLLGGSDGRRQQTSDHFTHCHDIHSLLILKSGGLILKLMSDDSKLRKFSLKAVEKIVEGDPQLMLLLVTKAVSPATLGRYDLCSRGSFVPR
jgi:hypothetical protein